ncbi:MAG: 30S ribosomal protein S4 [Dehalococcoidia bacterium]|nr:MAG: 30S ribosomal protein S4 [Dehalococcoidia bacterium]
MARYTGPVCRLCRRAGEKLMLKGERCATPKCSIERRTTPPGQRAARRRPRKLSDYALRLQEKQKARYSYGVLEQQFRRLFAKAKKAPGMPAENLTQLLERRLDNTVYRLGFADSRNQARQLVRHGHIMVNERKVDIPSFLVKPGDVIAWREKSIKKEPYKKTLQGIDSKVIPSWLSLDKQNLSGRVLTLPVPDEIATKFDGKMIVEYYSR